MTKTKKGSCFCGAVAIQATGEPEVMGFCHCASCRSWSAAPVNGFALYRADKVRVIKGMEHIGHYKKTDRSDRQFCVKCGGHLMTGHPQWRMVDVAAATIPTLKFAPEIHHNYAEAVLPMTDGLPKMRDVPKDLGGTGETLDEND